MEGIITTIPLYAVSAQLKRLPRRTRCSSSRRGDPAQPARQPGRAGAATDDPGDTLNVQASLTQAGQSQPLALTPNGDQYQSGWMPLTADAAQLHVTLELTDANKNSIWKCTGDAGDLPVDPVSVKAEPPTACTPVNTSLSVPLQLINLRTGQNTAIGLPVQWQVTSVTQPGGRALIPRWMWWTPRSGLYS